MTITPAGTEVAYPITYLEMTEAPAPAPGPTANPKGSGTRHAHGHLRPQL